MNSSYSSLDWVLSHWAHMTVHRFICVCVYLFVLHMSYIIVTPSGGLAWIEALSLGPYLPLQLGHFTCKTCPRYIYRIATVHDR